MAKILNDSLITSKPNAPLDVRTEVATLADVVNISNPSESLVFKVLDTGKYYKVESLKIVQIEGTTHTKKIIDSFSPLGDVEEAPKNDKQYARVNGTWVEVGAGAVSEVALITLTPAVAELNGVTVKVTTNEGETLLDSTWEGAQLSVQVRAGLEYTVSVGDKEGFIAPQAVTHTAIKGATRSINMAYIESRLKVNILSNQGEDSAISSVKATVKYGSTSVQVANGVMVNIPLNVDITITFPDVEGYKTPDAITYTHTSGSYEKSGTYQTEVVKATLSADNNQSLSGQIVTINGTQHTWTGTAITQKVAFGTEYTVSVNEKEEYKKPIDKSFTANQVSRDVNMQYKKLKITKIRIDQTISDPATMITRIVDGGGIEAIRANSHRYTGKFANGVMTLKQLDDADGTKYVDGTAANLTTIGTDVWMKLPQFHWKCTEHATDVWDFEVAYGEKPDDTYKTWEGNDLIGVYKVYIDSDNHAYSASDVKSSDSLSRAGYIVAANARGNGFSTVKWRHHCMMAMLYYTQYNNTDSQAYIGEGSFPTYNYNNGKTNSFGMTDTAWTEGDNASPINFWGLENWWFDKYEVIGNISVQYGKGVVIEEDDGTERNISMYPGDGFIKKMAFGDNIDLLPTDVTGSGTTGFCDKSTYVSDAGNDRAVLRAGSNLKDGGIVALESRMSLDFTGNASISSRLAFKGNIVIE